MPAKGPKNIKADNFIKVKIDRLNDKISEFSPHAAINGAAIMTLFFIFISNITPKSPVAMVE
jgi:hypothetical protein